MRISKWLPVVILTFFCISLSYANKVKGLVFSSEDNSPLIGVDITASIDSMPVAKAKSGNKGEFRLVIPEHAGLCVLTINQVGYEPHYLTIMNAIEDLDLGKISLVPSATILEEVSVSASSSRSIDLPDKSIIFPTEQEKERAANPLNLMTQLSFSAPMLSVDEYGKKITVNGQTPQILINGVRRTYTDFNALNPRDILKVEYIAHPDLRYGMPYINIITVRPPTGGAVLAELTAPVTTRQENHQLYSSYRNGMNEIAVNYTGLFRDSHKEHRDVIEKYLYPDKTYEINFESTPSRILDRDHSASVEYSLTGGPKKILVTTASLSYHSYDTHFTQLSENTSDPIKRNTHQDSKNLTPGLNLYGSLPIATNGRIEMNISGAYAKGDYLRALSQNNGYSEFTTTNSRSYSVLGELYYEHRFSWSNLAAGLTQAFSKANNSYEIEGKPLQYTLHKSRTSASLSLSGQIHDIVYYYASAGFVSTKVDKVSTSPYSYLMLQKKLGNFNLGYTFSLTSSSPGLSSYSEVLLPVNEILYRKGNLMLKDEVSIQNQLTTTYSHRKFSARLSLSNNNVKDTPVTICTYNDNPSDALYGKFLETSENNGRYRDFIGMLTAGFSNLLDHYSILIMGSYKNMSTKWSDHRWEKAYFKTGGYVAAYYGPWQFSVQVYPFPSYSLIGNMLWRDYTFWGVNASWHKGNWSVSCQIADLFTRRAFYQEKKTMAIGSVTDSRTWIGDKNNWVSLSLRYQLDYGQQTHKPQRNVRGNTRVDSGVSVTY